MSRLTLFAPCLVSLLFAIGFTSAQSPKSTELIAKQTVDSQISAHQLRIEQPEFYILDSGDVLGVFIDKVFGKKVGLPPVNLPNNQQRAPSIGYPIKVDEKGQISLPRIKNIDVRGKTIAEVEELVKRAYFEGEKPILKKGARVIVTLTQERRFKVFVIRADQESEKDATGKEGTKGRGFVIEMPAYSNDVLNALSTTGGLPNFDHANVRVLRGNELTTQQRENFETGFNSVTEGSSEFPFGLVAANSSAIRSIPIRSSSGKKPSVDRSDIELNTGDIVYVDNGK